MKDTMKMIIRTLRLGNLALVMERDMGSRADMAMNQDNLLDMIELFVDKCEVTEKEKK